MNKIEALTIVYDLGKRNYDPKNLSSKETKKHKRAFDEVLKMIELSNGFDDNIFKEF